MTRTVEQGEFLDEELVGRIEALTDGAVRRKPAQESHLAGSLRILAPHSALLREALAKPLDTLVKRESFERPLYAGVVRALAERAPGLAAPAIERALSGEEAGGLATLSAACWVESDRIADSLVKVAGSRHPHLAFAAEVARITRKESDGEHIASLAPKIKEAHRIALCLDVLVPLLRHPALPLAIAPALAVLRDAERHLGRWLVFAEIAARAGDRAPVEEARERAATGPASAKAAWALVAWALSSAEDAPQVRPTVEIVSRLSDRPSADRDPTFLYRLAEARVPAAKPMLESLVRGPLGTDTSVRAAMYLARDHGRDDLRASLASLADNPRKDTLRGMAASALYDLGERERTATWAADLQKSRKVPAMTWGALIGAALRGSPERVLTEHTYRRIQLGWVE